MGYMRASTLLMGLALVGFLAIVVSGFWSNLAADYNVTGDNATINNLTESYNVLENLTVQSEYATQQIENAREGDVSAIDKIGGLASNLWTTMKFIKNSIPLINTMYAATADALDLGTTGIYLGKLISIVFVLALLFILVYLIFKVQV